MWKSYKEVDEWSRRRVFAYANQLAVRVLQSDLYYKDTGVRAYVDTLIELTMKKEDIALLTNKEE